MVRAEWFCTPSVDANDMEKFIYKIGSVGYRLFGQNVYYNDSDSKHDVLLSDTWNNAAAQYEFFPDPNNGYINGEVIHVTSSEELKQVRGVQVGDLIYWDWYDDSDGIVNHATIISRIDKDGTIYFAGNTKDRLEMTVDKQLSQGEIYIVRLNDCIFE